MEKETVMPGGNGKRNNTDIKRQILSSESHCTDVKASNGSGISWCPRLSRFKIVGLFTIIILLVVVLTYQLTMMHHRTQGSSVNMKAFTQSSDSNSQEYFRDKIRYKHTKRRLPQCLIIGIRKAGTRALLTYLNLHPHVQTASEEIHFFDNDENYSHGLEWYRKRMPYSFPEEITLEKTPAYFATQMAPDRIYHMNSSLKLLLVVREPIDRMVSDYLQITLKKESKGLKTRPFEKEIIGRNGEVNTKYPPLVRSVYYIYMENWLRKYPLSQIHIVDGDRLIKDPFPEMQAVERFLGLEHRIQRDMFYFNESRGFYCIRNETREKCLAESKGRTHPDINPNVLRKLKVFFQPYNQKFYDLIGKPSDPFRWDKNIDH